MSYYIPQWEERTSYGFRRIDPYAKLFEDRIIFLGTPISDDVANAVMAQLLCLQQMDPDRDIQHLHQQPRRLVHRDDGDLRHDALPQARRADRLPGPGRLGRRRAAGRRRAGQAARAAEQPDPHPPAVHRGHLGQASDLEIQANEILRMRELLEEMIAEHSGKTSRRSAVTSSATRSSPPSRRWSTA